jgi:hypothetical protein
VALNGGNSKQQIAGPVLTLTMGATAAHKMSRASAIFLALLTAAFSRWQEGDEARMAADYQTERLISMLLEYRAFLFDADAG